MQIFGKAIQHGLERNNPNFVVHILDLMGSQCKDCMHLETWDLQGSLQTTQHKVFWRIGGLSFLSVMMGSVYLSQNNQLMINYLYIYYVSEACMCMKYKNKKTGR